MGLDRMARNAVGIFCSTNTEKNRCLELPPYYYRDDNCQDIKLKDYQDEDYQEATRQHQIGALAQPMWTPPMAMGGRGGDIKVTASRQAAGAHAKHKNGLAA